MTLFVAEVQLAFESIEREPRALANLEWYLGPREFRRYVLKRFPYFVVFECRTDRILIVAVSHVRRKPLYWLDRLTE